MPLPTAAGKPILIIDDHELFSTALRVSLRTRGFDVHQVAVTSGLSAILARAGELPAGLALVDLHLGKDKHGHRLDGVDLIKPLRNSNWTVLVVSGSRDDSRTAAAIANGAAGQVAKSSAFEVLLDAVLAAAAGRPLTTAQERNDWLRRHRGYEADERLLHDRLGRLSPREAEVLALLGQGFRASMIADQFTVSITTVRAQIRSILAKLEVSSQLEAVALAQQRPADP